MTVERYASVSNDCLEHEFNGTSIGYTGLVMLPREHIVQLYIL